MSTKHIMGVGVKAWVITFMVLLLSSIFVVDSPLINANPSHPDFSKDVAQWDDTIEVKSVSGNTTILRPTRRFVSSSTQGVHIVGPNITTKRNPLLYSFSDGDLVRATGTDDIFIIKKIGNTYYKRLILNPAIFESYGHLRWENVKKVSQSLLNKIQTSNLVRHIDGGPVYALFPSGDVGVKRHLQMTAQQFKASGYSWEMVYNINTQEAGPDFYRTGAPITYKGTANYKINTENAVISHRPTVVVGYKASNLSIPTTQRTSNNVRSNPSEHLLNNVIAKAKQEGRGDCFERMFGAEQVVGDSIQVPLGLCTEVTHKKTANFNRVLIDGTYYQRTFNGSVADHSTISLTINTGNRYNTSKVHFLALKVMTHEICHANQHYHAQASGTNGKIKRSNGTVYYVNPWSNSPAGKMFIQIVEYTEVGDGHYKKPTQSNLPFHQYAYYGYNSKSKASQNNAIEFGAEVCTYFFLDRAGKLDELAGTKHIQALLNYQPLRYCRTL